MKRETSPSNLPDFYSPSKRAKLRNESSIPVIEMPPEILAALPSNDTLVAIQVVKELIANVPRVPPVVFRSQVYYSIPSRTTADQELIALVKEGTIRMFRVIESADDTAIILTEDYKALAEKQKAKLEKNDVNTAKLIDKFVELVLTHHQEMRFSRNFLRLELDIQDDDDYRSLIELGFMIINDAQSYWISIPGFGVLNNYRLKARTEILNLLKKQKFSEMSQALLEKKELTSSPLPVSYHIRDMVGSNILERTPTSTGHMIRIARS